MAFERQDLIDKMSYERFRLKMKIQELEKVLIEKSPKEFQAWLSYNEALEELNEFQYSLLEDEDDLLNNEYLKVHFERFVLEIINDDFKDKFYTIFNYYIESELKGAYDSFLADKGLMAVFLKLRNYLDVEESRVRDKIWADIEEWELKQWNGEVPKLPARENVNMLLKIRRTVEQSARKRLEEITDEYLENLQDENHQSIMNSIRLSESIIASVCEFVSNSLNEKLQSVVREYQIVSEVLQKNIKKRRLEK
ncbi:MAG: hypothetical protein AAF740_08840 [Bacteroidota bacterium]